MAGALSRRVVPSGLGKAAVTTNHAAGDLAFDPGHSFERQPQTDALGSDA